MPGTSAPPWQWSRFPTTKGTKKGGRNTKRAVACPLPTRDVKNHQEASHAIEDLDKAIQANLADSTQFVNCGAVAPRENGVGLHMG
jgi:hypothetical protein